MQGPPSPFGLRRGSLARFASEAGGAERDRTADLLIANEALSQLSYSPKRGSRKRPRGGPVSRDRVRLLSMAALAPAFPFPSLQLKRCRESRIIKMTGALLGVMDTILR